MGESLKNCRCCMESDLLNTGVVNILESNYNGLQMSLVFLNCTGIRISDHSDQLPLAVCLPCLAQLQGFHEFREKCIQSDKVYRGQLMLKREPLTFLDGDDTKVESIYVDIVPSWIKEDEDSIKDELDDVVEQPDSPAPDSDADEEEADAGRVPKIKKIKIKRKKEPSKPKAATVRHECFPCTFGDCIKKFYVKRRYEGHMRQHNGLKAAVCTFCGKQFAKWISHDQHVDAEHSNKPADIKCDYPDCQKMFTTRIYKARHIRSTHTHRQKTPTEAAFICHQCGKAFVAFSRLREHLYIHMPNVEKPHKCQQCGKSFIKKHKLKNHIMRHEGIKNFVCPHCGMRKTTKEELRVHINCHTREKTYKCTHCEKEFSKYENMKRHVRVVHEGIRAFHCTYCDQSFGKAETLKHHIMTHTGEKPHKCTICDRSFIQQTALKTHMATHLR